MLKFPGLVILCPFITWLLLSFFDYVGICRQLLEDPAAFF